MPKTKADNRAQLLNAAEKTTYRYGFGNTSIADIAKEARLPLGNVYYYFKTKAEISEAIIDLRVSRFRKLLQEFDQVDFPKERLCSFVQVKIKNSEELATWGCPVGGLCSELRKLDRAVADKSQVLFGMALAWMQAQFQQLGKGEDSLGLAVHLLSATQGVSLLAHTFHDPQMIVMEAERLQQWIRSL